MKKFSYKNELKKIIDEKQLVEVRLGMWPSEFRVAYILYANDEYLTLAEIYHPSSLDGVCMYRMADVDSIKTQTSYLKKFSKKVVQTSLYEQAVKDIETLHKPTFEGFISSFEGTSTIVEVMCEGATKFVGKIVGHDANALAIDEYDESHDQPIAHSLVNLSSIVRLSLDIPWTREIF